MVVGGWVVVDSSCWVGRVGLLLFDLWWCIAVGGLVLALNCAGFVDTRLISCLFWWWVTVLVL